jgi:NAD(P)-dependent dehydrogenase (short-subunit alcohol dehydrogenase family)
MFEIAPGRKVLITGGASGFGLAVAQQLSELQAFVAIADIDEGKLADAASQCRGRVLTLAMDVTDPVSVGAGVGRAADEFGGLDSLVNCAGVWMMKPFLELTEREWDFVLDVNLKGTFLACQAALPHLIESGRGRIVNVSSPAGRRGSPMLEPYVSSKWAVIGLTESLALEFGPQGVTVNAALPPSTPDSQMGQQVLARKIELGLGESPSAINAMTARASPLRRVGTVADGAAVVLFLLSEAAGFITGQAVAADGGITV